RGRTCRNGFGLGMLTPTQGVVESAGTQKPLDVADSGIAAGLHVLEGEPGGSVCVVQFLRASPGVPLWAEAWKDATDSVAINPVTPLIGAAICCVFHAAAGHSFGNDIRQIPYAVVLVALAHIKGFVVNRIPRCFEYAENGSSDIPNMHDRTPG